jgi:predicted AAA+ superfamily ATPase
MMIVRALEEKLVASLQQFPIACVLGPRQSGKTTLCKTVLPGYTYVNLEDLSLRNFAIEDPKGFLQTYSGRVIIDEVQNVPQLLSYLQLQVDETQQNGVYVLTGSHNFLLSEQITQSLAGRVAIFNLLPFSLM